MLNGDTGKSFTSWKIQHKTALLLRSAQLPTESVATSQIVTNPGERRGITSYTSDITTTEEGSHRVSTGEDNHVSRSALDFIHH